MASGDGKAELQVLHPSSPGRQGDWFFFCYAGKATGMFLIPPLYDNELGVRGEGRKFWKTSSAPCSYWRDNSNNLSKGGVKGEVLPRQTVWSSLCLTENQWVVSVWASLLFHCSCLCCRGFPRYIKNLRDWTAPAVAGTGVIPDLKQTLLRPTLSVIFVMLSKVNDQHKMIAFPFVLP